MKISAPAGRGRGGLSAEPGPNQRHCLPTTRGEPRTRPYTPNGIGAGSRLAWWLVGRRVGRDLAQRLTRPYIFRVVAMMLCITMKHESLSDRDVGKHPRGRRVGAKHSTPPLRKCSTRVRGGGVECFALTPPHGGRGGFAARLVAGRASRWSRRLAA